MLPPARGFDRSGPGLVPTERTPGLVLDDPGLEEISFLLEIGHFAHPWERIARSREHLIDADLLATAIGDVAQVLLEHRSVEPQNTARHGVLGIAIFELDRLPDEALNLLAEFGSPQVRVLHLDLVDEVDAEIAMHRLVAQDVLILLGGAGHLVLPAQRQNLGETDIEEHALHHAGEHDEAAQQLLIGLGRTGPEGRVGESVDERNEELVLVTDARDLVVGVEYLALVQTQALDDVLVGVSMDGLLERLPQEVLPAFGRSDVTVGTENDVVRSEGICRDEEAQVALDQASLVLGQPVRVFPQGDVSAHVDFLRHPVIGAGGKVFFPRPFVLERHELIDVGPRVDDALVLDAHAAMAVSGRIALVRRPGGGRRRQPAYRMQVEARDRLGPDVIERKHFLPPCSRARSRSLAGLAFRIVYLAVLGFRLTRWAHSGGRARGRHSFSRGNGVQLAGPNGRFLRVSRTHRAQVVSGLQASLPGKLVALVQLPAGSLPDVDVERLGLVDPFLPPRAGFDDPHGFDFGRGGIEAAQIRRYAIDAGKVAVEVLEIGD